MVWMRKSSAGLLACLVALLCSSCAARPTTKSFLRPNVSLNYIRAVGVLPFEGAGGAAAEQTREIVMMELLASERFDVVDKGRVDAALAEEAVERGKPIDVPTLRRLAQRLGVQGFIFGSVEPSVDSRAGGANYPEITLALRLVEAEGGVLLWQAAGRASGYSLADRLFGLKPRNAFDVTLELLSDLMRTMGAPSAPAAQAPK
jgi:hypothetical protein